MIVRVPLQLVILGVLLADPPEKRTPAERKQNYLDLRPGMTSEDVKRHLGEPDRRPRQILYRRYLEQWIYDEPAGLWVRIDCLKGQDPRVVTIHPPGGE